MIYSNFLIESKRNLISRMRLLHEDEGIMVIICLAINVFFFLKVVGHRISDIKLFAACICSPLKNILIFSETFSDTLP